MPNYLHRTSKEYLLSVSPSSLPEPVANYIIAPILSAVVGYPSKYWIITGDDVTLMDQAARDAVDVAEIAANRDDVAGQMDSMENIIRAFALAVLDEFNVLRAQHSLPERTISQLKTAVRNKLGS